MAAPRLGGHPRTKTRSRISAEEWGDLKERILDLFVNQAMSLSQVSDTMAAEYGFHARYNIRLSYADVASVDYGKHQTICTPHWCRVAGR